MVRKGGKTQQLRTCGGKESQGRNGATFTLAFKSTDNSATAAWCLAEVEVRDEPVPSVLGKVGIVRRRKCSLGTQLLIQFPTFLSNLVMRRHLFSTQRKGSGENWDD